MLAIATYDFVVLEGTYYGQPQVLFTNEMIVEALVEDSTGLDKVYQFSTIQDLQNKFSNKISSPKLSVISIDENNDLRNENIQIEFKFDKSATTDTVKSLHILFYLRYFIADEVNTQLKTLVYLELDAPNGDNLALARMKGPLKLKQKNPIAPGTMKREIYDSALKDDFLQYGIQGIIDLYQLRNQTTVFDAKPLIHSFSSTTETKLSMDIQIPTIENIIYWSSTLQTLKIAWIQYLAFLLPIYFILYIVLYGFVVKSNVLD